MKTEYPEVDSKPVSYIFRTWRKDPRTGEILYAKDYGLKAWRIPIYRKKPKNTASEN